MMLYRLGADADIGIFTEETVENGELLITWAQRNRISEQSVQPRAAFVVESVLPAIDTGQAQSDIPPPLMLPKSESWRDTVVLSTSKEHHKKQAFKGLRVTKEPVFERWLPLPVEKG